VLDDMYQDTFTRAAPVTGGIGKVLLERMGWRAGTGLGKHNAGITVPLAVDIKTDRRGLCPYYVLMMSFHEY